MSMLSGFCQDLAENDELQKDSINNAERDSYEVEYQTNKRTISCLTIAKLYETITFYNLIVREFIFW